MRFFSFFLFLTLCAFGHSQVELGVDLFFKESHFHKLKGKKIGLVTNHTGRDRHLALTADLLKNHPECDLRAVFSPEHGLKGQNYSGEKILEKNITDSSIRYYTLHGDVKRPTEEMLKDVDVLLYDIQEIGSRSYSYATTLFYLMEVAAKLKKEVIVLDRPNPLNGNLVDGPMLEEHLRSMLGYINVPYCHGMTIGELARFFNEEYHIGCPLTVIAMKGWKREMCFEDTGLPWVPTSPNIPEPDSPYFYAATGILSALSIVDTGVGYTLPFKIVGAPWIDGEKLAENLNKQNLAGVKFIPFYYRPFAGRHKNMDCEGVKIMIIDKKVIRPLAVDYMLIGIIKSMYPKHWEERMKVLSPLVLRSFSLVNGNDNMLELLRNEKYVAWKLIEYDADKRKAFMGTRAKYLLY